MFGDQPQSGRMECSGEVTSQRWFPTKGAGLFSLSLALPLTLGRGHKLPGILSQWQALHKGISVGHLSPISTAAGERGVARDTGLVGGTCSLCADHATEVTTVLRALRVLAVPQVYL